MVAEGSWYTWNLSKWRGGGDGTPEAVSMYEGGRCGRLAPLAGRVCTQLTGAHCFTLTDNYLILTVQLIYTS